MQTTVDKLEEETAMISEMLASANSTVKYYEGECHRATPVIRMIANQEQRSAIEKLEQQQTYDESINAMVKKYEFLQATAEREANDHDVVVRNLRVELGDYWGRRSLSGQRVMAMVTVRKETASEREKSEEEIVEALQRTLSELENEKNAIRDEYGESRRELNTMRFNHASCKSQEAIDAYRIKIVESRVESRYDWPRTDKTHVTEHAMV